ncbi:hypothetical protein [Nostoc sp.]|uniref:hypothetical protein n=1 Tax=Nostoc sp. TaxID=1180 RepID=UPI002FF5ACE4
MLNYKKFVGLLATLPIVILSLWSGVTLAETLKTKSFNIKITRNCSEGSVTCDHVTYYGRNLKTGSSIRLTGKTIHRTCADGVTPCRFLGYEFRNQQYLYRVTEDGRLQVYQGGKLILEEQGVMAS